MLVLNRKPGETLRIGDDIVITQLDRGRIGIEAPKSLKITRGDLPQQDTTDGGQEAVTGPQPAAA